MRQIKKVLFFVALLVGVSAFGQTGPVKWSASTVEMSANSFKIVFKAAITAPWHMYDLGPYVGGPNATAFTFQPGTGVSLDGSVKQVTEPIVEKDSQVFKMDVRYFDKSAQFEQLVKLADGVVEATLNATVEWMVCDEMSCMPPKDHDFTITIKSPENKRSGSEATGSGSAGSGMSEAGSGSAGSGVEAGSASTAASQGLSSEAAAGTDAGAAGSVTGSETGVAGVSEAGVTGVSETEAQKAGASEKSAEGARSIWSLIIEAILWGFAALLTPCVFPMVPMTVSFFMKSNEDNPRKARRMASFFGIAIVALYTLPIFVIIAVTRIIGGDSITADIFNWVATHWIPNVLFFVIFMLFAASFFGAFEIRMPSKLVNRSDRGADKGGLIGTFFLAMTLVLVSFSCTGPIVGTVLIKSTSGEVWMPVVTMLAFSLAFALPFTLLAFFPSWLTKLPKSGGWLNSVKVSLGFIELALGLKFLSVADQTYHWGILDREIYLALWIVIFALFGLYLLGKLRFKHDSKVEHIGITRLGLSIVVFSFVIYMLPGMWGAPLKGLSGYLPPIHTQDFVVGQYDSSSAGANKASSETNAGGDAGVSAGQPKYADFLSLPLNLKGYFDYNEAMAQAVREGKPLFIDFTGHGCVNCREMEQRVWSDPRVLRILREEYVILALYVDDKKVLPQSEWVTTNSGKVLKSLGKINSHFANKRYDVNYQPYYLIVGADGDPLVPGRGYNLDIEGYVSFLESGLEGYNRENGGE